MVKIILLCALALSTNGCCFMISRPVEQMVVVDNKSSNTIIIQNGIEIIESKPFSECSFLIKDDIIFRFNNGFSLLYDFSKNVSVKPTKKFRFSFQLLVEYKFIISDGNIYIVDEDNFIHLISKILEGAKNPEM